MICSAFSEFERGSPNPAYRLSRSKGQPRVGNCTGSQGGVIRTSDKPEQGNNQRLSGALNTPDFPTPSPGKRQDRVRAVQRLHLSRKCVPDDTRFVPGDTGCARSGQYRRTALADGEQARTANVYQPMPATKPSRKRQSAWQTGNTFFPRLPGRKAPVLSPLTDRTSPAAYRYGGIPDGRE